MNDAVLITLIIVAGVLILFFGIVAVGLYIQRRDQTRLSDDPMRPTPRRRRSKDSTP